jgi:hypothetical protein
MDTNQIIHGSEISQFEDCTDKGWRNRGVNRIETRTLTRTREPGGVYAK